MLLRFVVQADGVQSFGHDFGRRFFMCENYEYDPPKRYGKDKPKVSPRTI